MAKKIRAQKRMTAGQIVAKWVLRIILYAWLLTILFPIYWMFVTAFKETQEFMLGNTWGIPEKAYLVNFITAWVESDLANRVLNSLFVIVLAVILSMLSATTTSYVLTKYDFKPIHWLEKFYFFAMMIPGILLLVPQYMNLANTSNWIQTFVQTTFNMPDFQLTLTDSLVTLAFVYGFGSLPATIYLQKGFMRRIDKSFIEAAKIDGAGEWKVFMKVVVPFMKPILLYEALTKSIGNWNEYMTALTFLESAENYTVAVGIDKLVRQFTYESNYGAVFAGMTISMVPILILYLMFQKVIQNGMDMDTGLK